MEQIELPALELIQNRRRRRRWWWVVAALAVAVALATVYLLILPAMTLRRGDLQVQTGTTQAGLEQAIWTEWSAQAIGGETYFVLSADGDNAGLDEGMIPFDGNHTATVPADAGSLELHRTYQTDGSVYYWFVLSEGETYTFSLPWVNGVDRYRMLEPEPQDTGGLMPQPPITVQVGGHAGEIERVQRGDPAEGGSLSISSGTGASLQAASDSLQSALRLHWSATATATAPSDDPAEQPSEQGTVLPGDEGVPAGEQTEPAGEEQPAADLPPEAVLTMAGLADGKFSCTFNQSQHDLSGHGAITLHFQMQGDLAYQRGGLTVTAVDADGAAQPLAYGEEYALAVSDDLSALELTLLSPGAARYQIEYPVNVSPDAAGGAYTVTVRAEVLGQAYEAAAEGVLPSLQTEDYVLHARKLDAGTNEPIAGAIYGLYTAQGERLALATSDQNGALAFTPDLGVQLTGGQLYYLQETGAAAHYLLDDTRYWFYYAGEGEADALAQQAAAEQAGHYRAGDLLVRIPNHGYTDAPYAAQALSAETTALAEPLVLRGERAAYELPETGGPGVLWCIIAGLALLVPSGLLLYKRKRGGEGF